jgi:hypothetical protein
MPGKDSQRKREGTEMDVGLLDADIKAGRLFDRPGAAADAALERERDRRLRAESVASNMARIVASESRRADDERNRRIEAEKVASAMAELVAHENARAEKAEARLRQLFRRD